MITTLVSFIIGVLSSVLVWLFTTKFSQVKIRFSEELSGNTDPSNESLYHYNVEVTNVGRRELIDIHMQAKISIEGADKKNPGLRCFALLNMDYFCNFPNLPYKNSRDKLWPCKNSGRLIYALNMEGHLKSF